MLIRNATRTYTQLFSNLETLFAKKDVLENHYVWHLWYLVQQKSLKCFDHKITIFSTKQIQMLVQWKIRNGGEKWITKITVGDI